MGEHTLEGSGKGLIEACQPHVLYVSHLRQLGLNSAWFAPGRQPPWANRRLVSLAKGLVNPRWLSDYHTAHTLVAHSMDERIHGQSSRKPP